MKFYLPLLALSFCFLGCQHKPERIDRDQVRQAIRAELKQFKSCYDKEYAKDKTLEGKIIIDWEIHAGGIAKNVRVDDVRSTIKNEEMRKCIVTHFESIQFPHPPDKTIAEVTYPFLFLREKVSLDAEPISK